ncbi:dihydrolipoamide acetyltransferase family protein [Aquisediminimonas sediminicola]|uniref:dihydrolipoamide acetyltransferase family protein n=1 Tax=Alteraquisediminimonas sediminicola TaxID=2676787 RepID=UPI001C8E3B63|nr:dihydrolipoamide acetyltransferase family protein [Aquisediminimonas sediminicola]
MSHAIIIPKLGLTMEEATLVRWHIPAGQQVAKGATLYSIETDKISFDVEAEADGYVDQIVPEGDVVPVGALVGYLLERPDEASPCVSSVAEAAKVVVDNVPVPAASAAPPPMQATLGGNMGEGARRYISPLARRIAASNGIDTGALTGSGPNGVILKRDVERAMAARNAAGGPIGGDAPSSSVSRRPMTAMRRAISQRMQQSLNTTAQMTGFGKVDMTEMVQWRSELLEVMPTDAPRITYTDIVTKACAGVLREMPELNSYIDGDQIVTWNDINVGIAVAIDGGLLVPVIRNADRLSLLEIAAQRVALIDRARTGQITPADLEGGTFTISNFGSYGGDFETPILNTPQSALLGIGGITDEPAVRDKAIVIRAMMMLSLTYDHRLIDGAVAGRFRARLRALLEHPSVMLALLG